MNIRNKKYKTISQHKKKVKHFLKGPWFWRVPITAGVLMVLLMIGDFNQSVFKIVNSALYIPIESIWLFISLFGSIEIITIILLPLLGRHTNILWAALISNGITLICVEFAKKYFALPRPAVILDYDRFHQIGNVITVDSFPSVNTAVAFSIAAVIFLSVRQPWIKISVFLSACLIALSQIAIGANWPIDIVSGVIIGWLLASVGFNLAKYKILKTKRSLKILVVFYIFISMYLLYNLLQDDLEVILFKIIILITCIGISFKNIRKILKS